MDKTTAFLINKKIKYFIIILSIRAISIFANEQYYLYPEVSKSFYLRELSSNRAIPPSEYRKFLLQIDNDIQDFFSKKGISDFNIIDKYFSGITNFVKLNTLSAISNFEYVRDHSPDMPQIDIFLKRLYVDIHAKEKIKRKKEIIQRIEYFEKKKEYYNALNLINEVKELFPNDSYFIDKFNKLSLINEKKLISSLKELILARIQTFEKNNKFNEAINEATKLYAVDSDLAKQIQDQLKMKKKDYEFEKKSMFLKKHYVLSKKLIKEKLYNKALSELEKIYSIEKDYFDTEELIYSIRKKLFEKNLSRQERVNISKLEQNALKQYNIGNYQQALVYFYKALRINPYNNKVKKYIQDIKNLKAISETDIKQAKKNADDINFLERDIIAFGSVILSNTELITNTDISFDIIAELEPKTNISILSTNLYILLSDDEFGTNTIPDTHYSDKKTINLINSIKNISIYSKISTNFTSDDIPFSGGIGIEIIKSKPEIFFIGDKDIFIRSEIILNGYTLFLFSDTL